MIRSSTSTRRAPWSRHPAQRVGALALVSVITCLAAALLTLLDAAPSVAASRGVRMGPLVRRPYPGAGIAPAMEAAIRVTWPVRYHRQALDVAWCESSGDPAARNGQYRGHFQMGRLEWERSGLGDPYDAEDNAAAAYRYFVAVGESWRPWQCRPAAT